MSKAAPWICRVLTTCTINGRACIAGDAVELSDPQCTFLVDHRMVVRVIQTDAAPIKATRAGKDGPPV